MNGEKTEAPRGEVVLVSGAFSGIGQAAALALARAGWTVYASGRTLSKSADLVAEARAAGVTIRTIVMDVTDERSVAAAIDEIARESGRLDVLVNNAGLAVHGTVTETSNVQIRHLLETNTIGMVTVSRAALELMRRHGQGRIVNISSVLSRMPFPGSGIYSASKAALDALSDTMRLELKLAGPRYHVSVIAMAEVRTKLGHNAVYAEYGGRPDSIYGDFNALARRYVEHAYANAPGPEVVAAAVLRAAGDRVPKPRYVVTPRGKIVLVVRRFVPDSLFDRLLLRLTPRFRRAIEARWQQLAQGQAAPYVKDKA